MGDVTKSCVAALILVLFSQVAVALETDIQWLAYPGKIEVTRTTVLLAQGRPQRALQVAGSLDTGELQGVERVILDHNRCLALHWLGLSTQAAEHCNRFRNADRDYDLQRIRGAYTVVAAGTEDRRRVVSLSEVLETNLYGLLLRAPGRAAQLEHSAYTQSGRAR